MEIRNRNNKIIYRDRRTHKLDVNKPFDNLKIPEQKVAYLYVRVSTDEQADRGFSQRDQDERLREYCQRNNITVGKVIYEDYSAKTFIRRPAWSKLLSELKKTKGRYCNLILFTKWDRFSRNTSNAYNMLDALKALSIEPNAIDQYLDLNVPESLIMLGVYISMAEVDNIKRGLSVADGMRKGKSEGRWMGKAPAGYINKIREDKTKYIDLIEPEATHIKWAFEAIAEGIYVTEEIWLLAKKRGLKCQKNTFWDLIRNPMYCGKIIVPANKHHETSLADGKHTPLISEELFWDVQDVLNGRKKTQKVKIETPKNLPLRGFLYCPNCNKNLTGSPSKGRSGYYYYYHCKSPCKARFSAETINADFIGELKKFVPLPGVVELFKEVVHDAIVDTNQNLDIDRKHFVTQITEQNNLLTKIRTMLLQDDISIDDYKTMKFECDERIIRLEVKLKQVKESDLAKKDLSGLIDEAMLRFKNLAELYSNGDIEEKRYIIGSIFDEKWTIIENKGRTGKPNVVAQLIYQINNMLRHKKTGVRTKIRTNPGSVPPAGVETL